MDLLAHEELARLRCPALIQAHPGHELYVLGWVKLVRPRIFVLTDGSGQTAGSRSESTASLIDELRATKGEVFCPLTDRAIYDAILAGDLSLFENLLETITGALIANAVDFVAGDSAEGFNPSHDICRFLIDGAVTLVKRRTGQTIPNYEIRLTTWENRQPDRHGPGCLHLELSTEALKEKLRAAYAYQGLQAEVRAHTDFCGPEHFRTECFRKALAQPNDDPADTRHYERVGQQRVREGIYRTPLRYRDHIRPIFYAIGEYATTR